MILRERRLRAVEFDRGGPALPDEDQLFVQRLSRVDGARPHLDALQESAAAPRELGGDARRKRDGRQRGAFDGHASVQRRRHGDPRQLPGAPRHLMLIDDPLITVGPRRPLVRTRGREDEDDDGIPEADTADGTHAREQYETHGPRARPLSVF